MKKRNWNIRKVAVAAAAMCILGSAVVMAAGQFTAFESHSYQNEAVADYSQIEAMSEKYGVPFVFPRDGRRRGRAAHIHGAVGGARMRALPLMGEPSRPPAHGARALRRARAGAVCRENIAARRIFLQKTLPIPGKMV